MRAIIHPDIALKTETIIKSREKYYLYKRGNLIVVYCMAPYEQYLHGPSHVNLIMNSTPHFNIIISEDEGGKVCVCVCICVGLGDSCWEDS